MVETVLNGAHVLVAEDQTYIALDLALAVEDAGGKVVGPAASVAEALDLLKTKTVAAAILDVELVGGDCWAIVDFLARRHIPTIIQTGAKLPLPFEPRFPDVVVHAKPRGAASLIEELGAMIGDPDPGVA